MPRRLGSIGQPAQRSLVVDVCTMYSERDAQGQPPSGF